MSRLLILLLAGVAAPASAQHQGHNMAPAPAQAPAPAADPTCAPEHAAMGHCTPKQEAPAPALAPPRSSAPMPAPQTAVPAAQPTCAPEHAAMGHCTPTNAAPAPAASPTAAPVSDPTCAPEHAAMGHCTPKAVTPPPPPADLHAGHAGPAAPAPDPSCLPEHAAMGHCTPGGGTAADIPVASPPAEARSGPEHAADTVWNPVDMAASRQVLRDEHGGMKVGKILIDRLEWANRSGKDGYAFDGQAWWGGDIDKVWLKAEGEGTFGEGAEGVEAQALWSHAIDPWFDLQLGLRQDFAPGPNRTYLTAGIQGLAPYWFEVDVSTFLSNKGEFSARAEAEYDLRITQRIILQPRIEFDLAAQDVPELGIGSGLSTGELGARLRYEVERQFAPYVGVQYERAFGDTADFRRFAGEKAGGWSFLFGLRSWF